jgi:hypothetical protein
MFDEIQYDISGNYLNTASWALQSLVTSLDPLTTKASYLAGLTATQTKSLALKTETNSNLAKLTDSTTTIVGFASTTDENSLIKSL